ncbi:MAG TPA: phosphatidylglycerol lysyltransferase domain-containing protein [Planctomycetota bacterium]|nr:phosphatidylglycerol lysyltransferase domain-containing protein [Planctomycetota bacterium]
MAEEIPQFPVFRPLGLEDRDLVERAFKGLGREASEFTFACFYMFRQSAEPGLSRLGDALLFRERCRGGGWCLLPPMLAGSPQAAADAAEAALRAAARAPSGELPGHIYGVTEALWNGIFGPGGRFERRPDRDNFDYVYERQELAELRGNRFHSKKNLINKFLRNHAFEYRRLTPDLLAPAKALAEHWCRLRCGPVGSLSRLETAALQEGLDRADALGLTVGLILVDGQVQALSLGERLSEDMAAIHFEKASPGIKGLGQLMAREFAAREFTGCRFFNREQDLGSAGLRRAKESYCPVKMVEKHVVSLAGDRRGDEHFRYAPESGEEDGA